MLPLLSGWSKASALLSNMVLDCTFVLHAKIQQGLEPWGHLFCLSGQAVCVLSAAGGQEGGAQKHHIRMHCIAAACGCTSSSAQLPTRQVSYLVYQIVITSY